MKEKEKIILGVSGGIDSAAALILLQEMGYDVIPVYLRMWEGGCNENIENLSKTLGVKILTHDLVDRFKEKVYDPFLSACKEGVMLSPCSMCNPYVKWYGLDEVAKSMGVDKIATGHYCEIVKEGDKFYILKSEDEIKDQSYFMWDMPQEILSKVFFPLSNLKKEEVKRFIIDRGLSDLYNKKESMGLCFMEGETLEKWYLANGISYNRGKVLDINGVEIGKHKGYQFYTLAQKRGLKINTNYQEGKYVVDIDRENNILVLGDIGSKKLLRRQIVIESCNFVDEEEVLSGKHLQVAVRGVGRNPKGYVTVKKKTTEGEYVVDILDDEAWAVVKGQPVVIYVKNRLLGGGIVK